MIDLDTIATAYYDARLTAIQSAPAIVGPHMCRYGCGRRFQFALAKLDGHAVCSVTPAFMSRVRQWLDSGVSHWDIARACGVNYRIVRAWYRTACQSNPDHVTRIQRPRVRAA